MSSEIRCTLLYSSLNSHCHVSDVAMRVERLLLDIDGPETSPISVKLCSDDFPLVMAPRRNRR